MEIRKAWAVAIGAALVAACGGGGGGASAPQTETPVPPPLVAPRVVTDVTLASSAQSAQTQVPFSFGQVFVPGDLPRNKTLSALLGDGSSIPLQVDVKATHADGSARHAILSGLLPGLSANETRVVQLAQSSPTASPGLKPADLIDAGFSASVQVKIAGQTYRAAAETLLQGDAKPWLSGPVANEWLISGALKDVQGNAHPHLTARFGVRWYPGAKNARVDVTLENNWAYEPAPKNFTYDLQIDVGGRTVYTQAGLTHFHHARWRKIYWWGSEPQMAVRHNIGYLLASHAFPSYDPALTISETALGALAKSWAAANTGLMAPGMVVTYMPTTGGRPDIGPLPQWSAMYLLSMDDRARTVTLGAADLAGSWPMHYRDKRTDLPVSLVDYPYMTLLAVPGLANNPVTKKSEAFPACGGDCSTAPYNYVADSEHQPSFSYLPYALTGDYYHLEEMHFWANFTMVYQNPYYRQLSKGILANHQIRGQAWSMRTIAHAAYITPDGHPMKTYFADRLADNLEWYNTNYVTANPNALGVLDGTGQYAFMPTNYDTPAGTNTGLAPWQDDFFTWTMGYLTEMGFSSAKPILAWKAKFPIGRMTAPGYCWIDAAVYALAVRPAPGAALFGNLADAYQATMRAKDANGQAIPLVNSTGARYLDQPCGSQAQADWRTQRDKDQKVGRIPWRVGEMDGYADSATGYPANMQPALAVAATYALPGAKAAWDLFAARSIKPDYTVAPQWAVVPRPTVPQN